MFRSHSVGAAVSSWVSAARAALRSPTGLSKRQYRCVVAGRCPKHRLSLGVRMLNLPVLLPVSSAADESRLANTLIPMIPLL